MNATSARLVSDVSNVLDSKRAPFCCPHRSGALLASLEWQYECDSEGVFLALASQRHVAHATRRQRDATAAATRAESAFTLYRRRL